MSREHLTIFNPVTPPSTTQKLKKVVVLSTDQAKAILRGLLPGVQIDDAITVGQLESTFNAITTLINGIKIKGTKKGQIFVWTGLGLQPFDPGTDTYLLSSDSTSPFGLTWVVPPAGGSSITPLTITAGLIDGVDGVGNNIFTWSAPPKWIFWQGKLLEENDPGPEGYTLAGNVSTLNSVPETGDRLKGFTY